MVIKYKNDIDDLVELNIFTGSLSIKRAIINKILPIVYSFVTLGLGIWLIKRYGGLEVTNRLLIFVLIVCNIFIWARVIIGKRKVFRKSVEKMVTQNPAYIQEKSVTRKPNEFVVVNLEDKGRKMSFTLEEVFRVIEKDGRVFVFRKDYSPILMIPNKAFHSEEDKEVFFKGLSIEQG